MNTIIDAEKKEVKVEQRVMQVLVLLAENAGKVVLREKIVTAVWNDYGGGDEGLNQVISILRKILKDSNKTLIETVPKKGYILHAVITRSNQTDVSFSDQTLQDTGSIQEPGGVKISRTVRLISGLLLLIVAGIVIYFSTLNAPKSPDVLDKGGNQQQFKDSDTKRGADVYPDSLGR